MFSSEQLRWYNNQLLHTCSVGILLGFGFMDSFICGVGYFFHDEILLPFSLGLIIFIVAIVLGLRMKKNYREWSDLLKADLQRYKFKSVKEKRPIHKKLIELSSPSALGVLLDNIVLGCFFSGLMFGVVISFFKHGVIIEYDLFLWFLPIVFTMLFWKFIKRYEIPYYKHLMLSSEKI